MKPNPKFMNQEMNKWQLDEHGVKQSQQIKSHPNSNEEAVFNHSNPEPMQGIVKSLIQFFEKG